MAESDKKTVNTAPADVEVGSAADVEEIMKKYDRESNTRIWTGLPKQIIRYAMAAFMIFMVWVSIFSTWDPRVRRLWFLGIIIVFVFLLYPLRKGRIKKPNYVPFYDIILAVVGLVCYLYQVFNLDTIIKMSSRIGTKEVVIGVIAILILAECCRRVVGIPILCVATVFIAYALLPVTMNGGGKTLKQLIHQLFYTTNGVLGTPIQVCSTYIFLFVLFGSFLEATGIANFFINCANSIAGSATGGPAKVAVISSALCGMVSGSSVGNTVTTGAVTIPLMKKTGYPGEFAGAVEAAASTGGQIMPPIMGAAAFLMAEMTGTPYADIIVKAILPAALYFTGIFLMVHFKAKAMGLKGLSKDELPKFKDIWPKIYLLLPLIVLVYMVVQSGTFTMAISAVISSLIAVVAGMVDKEKGFGKKAFMLLPAIPLVYFILAAKYPTVFPNFGLRQNMFFLACLVVFFVLAIICHACSKPNLENVSTYVNALEGGTKSTLSVAIACGVAGIIAGVVGMTGLGQLLISAVVSVAGNNLFIALVLTMLCCIVLGMGVPTTANYIIMATTCAPILVQMNVPLLAAHFFVFYFGIVADITPPVALAAYAGSAIAKSPPMKTALNATRLAIAAFIIPYIFVFDTAMLFIDTTPVEVVRIVITSFLGMFLVAAGLIGFMLRKLNPVLRLVSIAAGLCMIIPEAITDVVGAVILVVLIAFQIMANKRDKTHAVA